MTRNALGVLLAYALAALSTVSAEAQERRAFSLEDVFALRRVSDPQVSPDGSWVAYTVQAIDVGADSATTQIWMVSWDGSQNLQLTRGKGSAASPRWSPDGRFLSFLTARDAVVGNAQIWVLDRRGGDARQLTQLDGQVGQYAWSPDSKRVALEFKPAEKDKAAESSRPLVIDRYRFKNDDDGYVQGSATSRIHLFEIESSLVSSLTDSTRFDESDPAWSPDGTHIAFVSNRDADSDRTDNPDIWVAQAKAGCDPRRLTSFEGPDWGPLVWSPDGRKVAYAQGPKPRDWRYLRRELAVVPVEGGTPSFPAWDLDRDALQPHFSSDGRSLEFLVIDSRTVYPARVAVNGGGVHRMVDGKSVIAMQSRVRGRTAVTLTSDEAPAEVYALESGTLRKLTAHNDSWRSRVALLPVEDFEFASDDGVVVQGLLVKPRGYQAGQKYPAILWIHGGPYGQDDHEFEIHRQLFAARGYLVIHVNYRGSAGRGRAYANSTSANQGMRDVADLIGGVDHVIAMGLADPKRLGVGGWSYGGIMTDYIIAHDQRFKAAIAGAGAGNPIALYGTDQYVYLYEKEWGAPWENVQRWLALSYPLLHADQIRTPTLFVGGLLDFNVPIAGAEQMYQALKSLGVPTQLVIYPDEHHSIRRPSFRRDLLQRYLDWYDGHL